MKQFLKSYAFVVLILLYIVYNWARFIVFARLDSNFLHYTKIRLIFDVILVSHCLFILVFIFVFFKLVVNKAKLKLLKAFVVILFILLSGGFLVCDLVDGDRLVAGQIGREILITESGDDFIRNVNGTQDKKLPALDAWQGYAFDKEKSLMYSHLRLNKHVCGLSFEELPPQTVLLVEHGRMSLKGADEVSFKRFCIGGFSFLYTADSRIVVYIKKRDEYRYFDSHKTAEVVWVP